MELQAPNPNKGNKDPFHRDKIPSDLTMFANTTGNEPPPALYILTLQISNGWPANILAIPHA